MKEIKEKKNNTKSCDAWNPDVEVKQKQKQILTLKNDVQLEFHRLYNKWEDSEEKFGEHARGNIEMADKPYRKWKKYYKTQLAKLKKEVFGKQILDDLATESKLCNTAKYCPFCFEKAKENPEEFPIVYQKLAEGCDKVRCGHTDYHMAYKNHYSGKSFSKDEDIIPTPRLGKHKRRHGCG